MDLKVAWEWVKKNKLMFGLSVFAIVVISYWAFNMLWSATMMNQRDMFVSESSEYYYPAMGDLREGYVFERDSLKRTFDGSELEIRSGDVEVKSDDGEEDLEILKDLVEDREGYIERSSKYESNLVLRINAQVRIPVDEFDSFVGTLEDNFEIESFQLENYRVDIQPQLDELSVIKQTLKDFDEMRRETQELELTVDRIELLANITREMQFLAREQDRLERDLGGKAKQADFATLNIVFVEELDVELELWPDDLRNRLVDNLNSAMDSIFTILTSILTNSLVLLVKVVEYIVYITVFLIPVVLVWNLIKKRRKVVKS
jgi:hypothetical protein